MKKTVAFLSALMFCAPISMDANAVKIVAVVHESAITDYDVHQFSKIICNMEKMDYCNYDQVFPVALSSLVEENLKSEHLKKMEIKEENIVKEYEEYKRT